jgi:hypothetical protein
MLHTNGSKAFVVFTVSSFRDKKIYIYIYIYAVPSWDSNPAPPKLASYISNHPT